MNDKQLANIMLDLNQALNLFRNAQGSFDAKRNNKIESSINAIVNLQATFRLTKDLNFAQRVFALRLIRNSKKFN